MQNAELRIWFMAKHDIYDRTFEFACRIVRLHRTLVRDRSARQLSSQLLRAGTSIGANLEEAEAGQSKADFISKCRIALKEARETRYWLRLFAATATVKPTRLTPLTNEAGEIIAILPTIVRSASRSPAR